MEWGPCLEADGETQNPFERKPIVKTDLGTVQAGLSMPASVTAAHSAAQILVRAALAASKGGAQ